MNTMEEKPSSNEEGKPFSVLSKFRQFCNQKNLERLEASLESTTTQTTCGTVFQASSSSSPSPTSDKLYGKRSFDEISNDRPIKRMENEMHQGQREKDVGITEFIRDGPGFEVILKHRFSDFHVNEIDLQGNVVKLTSTEIPKEAEIKETLSEAEDKILDPAQWLQLEEIVNNKLLSSVDVDVTNLTKEKRQQIHKAVKKRFGTSVYSNTKDIKDKKIIQIGFSTNKTNHRFCNWPQERPQYVHFLLLKENIEMNEALNVISRFTRIKPNRFGYAGTKDKRGVTTQQMCVRKAETTRFKSCQKLRGIVLGNYVYKPNNLKLGDLSGNRFRIVLRHVKESDTDIHDAVEHFKETGFINYFGLQRFGQSAIVPTYALGKAILKGDWKLAVELILKPRPGETCYRDVKEAREVWWKTRDAGEALKSLTRKDKSIEGKILLGLKKHGPNAYQNSFDNLARHSVTMFLHSYQSLIWNKVVSRRVREFGLKVLPGDLIKVTSTPGDSVPKCEEEEDSDDDANTEMNENEGSWCKVQVRPLTAEEATKASVYDVVYPLPGDDIQMPENEIAHWYTQLLHEDGHTMDCFSYVNKKYGMYGSYRQIVQRAEDISWRTMRYSDPDEILLLSDVDVLKGKPPPTPDPGGPYKAVILEFNLNVCCYATMAIRELTKCETSTSNQAMLTNQARKDDIRSKMRQKELDEQCPAVEPDSVIRDQRINGKIIGDNNICDMETDEASAEKDTTNENNANIIEDEEGEMNKREAEADNFINKFLESTYHS